MQKSVNGFNYENKNKGAEKIYTKFLPTIWLNSSKDADTIFSNARLSIFTFVCYESVPELNI